MLEISIDWLQFTSKDPNYLYTIIEILRLDVKMFTDLPKGKLGYKKQLFYNNITVLYDGNEDMGTHVILSGKGCRCYENHYPIIELIQRIELNCLKCTRIDVAIDDKKGTIIPLDELVDDIIKGNVVSKWKTSYEQIKRTLDTGQIIGQTINIGSRQSEVFLRIYNKSLEQKIEGNWTRIELEVKGDKAVLLQSKITIDNIGQLVKGVINNYFRIVQPCEDSNKSRWQTKEYWELIIDTTEKVKLSRKKEEKTLLEIKKWVEKQVAPTLATIVMAEGGCTDFLYSQIEEGQKRIKPKHLNIINKEMGNNV